MGEQQPSSAASAILLDRWAEVTRRCPFLWLIPLAGVVLVCSSNAQTHPPGVVTHAPGPGAPCHQTLPPIEPFETQLTVDQTPVPGARLSWVIRAGTFLEPNEWFVTIDLAPLNPPFVLAPSGCLAHVPAQAYFFHGATIPLGSTLVKQWPWALPFSLPPGFELYSQCIGFEDGAIWWTSNAIKLTVQ